MTVVTPVTAVTQNPPRAAEQAQHAAVETEIARLRVHDEARRQYDAERAPHAELPPLRRLRDFLAEPDVDPEYRIEGALPTGANIVLAAQYKAGKSTLIGNLVRSLADADPFLDRLAVARPARRVVLIDDELDPRTMRRWLHAQRIRNTEAVDVLPLRGSVGLFDILDDATRARWADAIGAADILILDCLRPVLDALGMDENHDAGRFLVALDALKAETGIPEAVLCHHMGHSGERSRGDSRILDWPDATWRIVRENDDPSSPRYFSAFGRDVDIPEGRLEYDPDTRALSLAAGTRREARDTQAAEDLLPDVCAYIEAHPGCSGQDLERDIPGGAQTIRHARDQLVARGRTRKAKRAGRGGGYGYYPQTPSTPSQPRQDEVQTPSTPVYETGLGFDELTTQPRHGRTTP